MTLPCSWGICSDDSPVNVTVSLPHGRKFAQEESIKIQYDLENLTNNLLACDKDYQHSSWLSVEILQDKHLIKTWQPIKPGLEFAGRSFLGRRGYGEIHTRILAGSNSLTQIPPGRYTVRVHTKLAYAILGDSAPSSLQFNETALWKYIEASKLTDTRTFDFAITITPRNSTRWKQHIDKVYKAVVVADYNHNRELLDELALMPEEYALPVWRKVLFDKKMEQYYFAQKLSLVPSLQTADLLLSLQFSDPIREPRGRIGSVIPLLRTMARTGSTDVKEHIEAELVKHKNSTFYVPEQE